VNSIGNLIIKTDESFVTVELRDYNDVLYAKAKVPENFKSSVEKCVDSSRGYALKLTHDDGRFAWTGLVFHDRNAAFDFYACFEEYLKRKTKNSKPFEVDQNLISSLKKGAGKIKVKINVDKDPDGLAADTEFYK